MPMPAQPRLPLVPLTDPVVLFASNSISGSGLDSQMPDVDAISSGTAIGAVVGTVTVARSNGQKKEIIPSATSTKHHAKSKAKKASLPRCFGQSATVVPTAAFAAGLAKSPRLPSFGEALKALRAGSLTPKSPPSTVPPPSPPLAPLPLPPPPLSPLLAPLLSPPPPPLPPPALLPLPPPPQKVLKVVLPRAPICPVTRPTIHPWSPLGRLLSRGQPFPQVAHEQVLGKRESADKDEVGPETKKAKLEGEFQYQVGGKRKRENESFPSKTRTKRGRALAIPCSRFTGSQTIASTNCVASPPILSPTSVPPIGPATETPTAPPPQPPIAAIPPPIVPNSSLAETVAFVNDLPVLRAEIAWMRAQRTLRKASRGKKSPKNPNIKPAFPGYWEKYREN